MCTYKQSRDIFPTFEEIDMGACVYELNSNKYRFDEDEWEYKPYKRLDLEVVISHNEYRELINYVRIERDRTKDRKKLWFKFGLCGNNYSYRFPYSKEGWKDCVKEIKKILSWYQTIINRIEWQGVTANDKSN